MKSSNQPENGPEMKLADAGNTLAPALVVLQQLGCEVSVIPCEEEDGLGLWCAVIAGCEFVADDPLRLLGLVAIWQNRGTDWHHRGDLDAMMAVIEKTYPD